MSWIGVGDAYAQSYASLCAGTAPHIVRALGKPAGRTLLDVGAGEGTLAAALSRDGWQVAAAEPEQSMRDAALRQHPSLRVLDAALPSLPFTDGAFDVVTANFVLNHLDDPRAGARELRRVAREVVVAATWSRSPSWLWGEVTQRAGLRPAAGDRLPPERDFERTAAGFERMLRDAGWEPRVTEITWTWRASPEALWRSVEGGVAGAGAFYRQLDDGERAQFRAAFDGVVGERLVAGILPLEHTAAIAISR